jgi:hypothetical protein
LFPVFLLLKKFRGRFLFVSNPCMKGALMGFVLWLVCVLFFYIDAKYGVIGILRSESGPSFFALLTSSVQGFITAGIIIGAFSKKL